MPMWYLLAACALSMLFVFIGGVFYTRSVDQKRAAFERAARMEADRRWCSVLNTLDKAYSSNTPTTELGRQVAESIHRLSVEFGCKKTT